MDIPIKSVSGASAVSGTAFSPGDRAWSCLARLEDGSLERIDVFESERESMRPEGLVLCQWGHRIRKPEASEAEVRRAELHSTDEVFLSLYDEEPEGMDEAAAIARDQLKYFLSLQLERKRILRPLGGGRYRHMPSKREFAVPQLDLTPELVAAILGGGEPDKSGMPDKSGNPDGPEQPEPSG